MWSRRKELFCFPACAFVDPDCDCFCDSSHTAAVPVEEEGAVRSVSPGRRTYFSNRHLVGTAAVKLKQFSYSFVHKHTTFVPMTLPACPSPHACMVKARSRSSRVCVCVFPFVC